MISVIMFYILLASWIAAGGMTFYASWQTANAMKKLSREIGEEQA